MDVHGVSLQSAAHATLDAETTGHVTTKHF